MQCTMCGREITNPEANYCDYCGTSLRQTEYREVRAEQPKEAEKKEDRVPTLSFLGVMALPFNTFVGWLAYFVLMFYWAFSSTIQDSRKSFARATLIYTAVVFVFMIVIFGAAIAAMVNLSPELL
ncbi:MAG: zinc ribbon domain-containing protein [Lachnospiraceae bacterium]|nr:zinc ribbon domain-containing protein [Lachnospiraceae bacterium]